MCSMRHVFEKIVFSTCATCIIEFSYSSWEHQWAYDVSETPHTAKTSRNKWVTWDGFGDEMERKTMLNWENWLLCNYSTSKMMLRNNILQETGNFFPVECPVINAVTANTLPRQMPTDNNNADCVNIISWHATRIRKINNSFWGFSPQLNMFSC